MTKHLIIVVAFLIATASVCRAQYRPEKYGVIVGSNQSPAVRTANHSAMKACLDDAMRAGGSVLLPAGSIEMEVPNRGSSASSTLKINRSIQIIGTDRNLSKIKFGPESPSYDYSGFYVGPGTFVTFRNCTIEGPSNPGPNEKFNRLTYAILQSGMTYGPGKVQVYNTPGELRLEQVTIAGEWYTSIQGSHGDVALVLIDSDITGYTQCVTWSATFNLGKRLYAKNTYFHDAGLPGKGHLIYLSPVVSFEIDGCRFAGNYRFAVHHYGSGKFPPKFARLLNSRFESTCADAIETTNTGLTEIRNCIFENKRRAVALKGDTTIEDCTFKGSIVATYDRHSGVRINIKHCKFFGGGVITSVWPDCVWNISDCDFIGQGAGNIGIANGAPGTQIRVDNCRFSGHFKRGIVAAAGNYHVSNCNFDGTYGEAAIVYDDTSGNVEKLRVDNSSFATNGRSIWAKNGASGKVSGTGNHFGASQPVAKPGMYQELELRAGAYPTELSSRAQLVMNFDYNSYRVTGETRIERIDLGGNEATTQMCAGKLQLVAAGRWSLGDTGNIKPLTKAPRRRGETVALVRDVQAGLWVEVAN